jgi:DNA replicative helicase MCM subunit Mcm2 (Cdc46/Mcm family)
MLRVPGIVISAARAKPKAIVIVVRCKNCNKTKHLVNGNAFGHVQFPRTCDG